MNDVMNNINVLNSKVVETELNVLESLSDSYIKALTILENYEGEDLSSFEIFSESFVQEGEILDKAMGKGKDENVFFKIVAFLPRLVVAFAKALKNALTADYKECGDVKTNEEMWNKATDEEKQILIEEAEKKIDEMNLPKEEKAQWKKTLKNLKTDSTDYLKDSISRKKILVDVSKATNRLLNEVMSDEGQIKNAIREIKALIKKEKDIDFTSVKNITGGFVGVYDDVKATANLTVDSIHAAALKAERKAHKYEKMNDAENTEKYKKKAAELREAAKEFDSLQKETLRTTKEMLLPFKILNIALTDVREIGHRAMPILTKLRGADRGTGGMKSKDVESGF